MTMTSLQTREAAPQLAGFGTARTGHHTMREGRNLLPAGCMPRGLRREQAAQYVGVSASKFDEMVKDGLMPRAKKFGGCVVWDVRALDGAFEALPDADARPTASSWAEVG